MKPTKYYKAKCLGIVQVTNVVGCMGKFILYILNYFNILERGKILQTIIWNQYTRRGIKDAATEPVQMYILIPIPSLLLKATAKACY